VINVVTVEERAAASVVQGRLNLPPRPDDKSQWPIFAKWAAEKKLSACPAAPATCALFVLSEAHLGVEKLLAVLESVSAFHSPGADPTLSPFDARVEQERLLCPGVPAGSIRNMLTRSDCQCRSYLAL
jgi:hypothetical protein